MSDLVTEACVFVASSLTGLANPDKAAAMQAYMKTDVPFYGVQKPERAPVLKHLVREFAPTDRVVYERLVMGLWRLPHREEKYLALGVATAHRQFILPESLPLYRRLIVEGAWWDYVDEVATHLIRHLVVHHPGDAWPEVDSWIDDEVMWLRRSAIICQVGAKDSTDRDRLFGFCLRRAHEKEFFVRKAIGWALRDYAWTHPEAVARFAVENREALSGLSFREAIKNIRHLVPS